MTCAVSIAVLSYYFVHHMPRASDPDGGRTSSVNIHGWIVYVSTAEKFTLNVLYAAVFIAAVIAVILFWYAYAKGSIASR
jgi:hypothetical protein